jgi:inhibitor of KinA sporulation pathway (predicted exonuclease)
MRYIVTDLEATCWDRRSPVDVMETIEFGSVALQTANGPVVGEFSSFVKPMFSPILSDFCKKLTTITQEDVDNAEQFYMVFPRFMEWIGDEPFIFCSWGAYDLGQLKADCNRCNMTFPAQLNNHINLKKEFSRLNNIKPMGMERALAHAGLTLEGTHHRGIDDARNIANLALQILPQLESLEEKGQFRKTEPA